MNYIKYLLAGTIFGITLAKAEIISWYRIYEMFRFDAFHMYGVIGSAVILGVIITQWVKRSEMKSIDGGAIKIEAKPSQYKANIIGGIIFGLGWALVGACPGPIFILLGYGYWTILLVILGALLGAFSYGLVRKNLPH